MAYLYKHIRLDNNEPFYIGIGEDSIKNQGKYKRANSKNRNKFWKNIVNKTLYKVEILFENLTWEEACFKEIELIKLYGRRDLGTGILCNLTDGGEGIIGFKYSEKIKQKMSKNQIGRSRPHKNIRSDKGVKRVLSKNHIDKLKESGKKRIGKPNFKARKPRINKENMFGPKPGRRVPKPNSRKPKTEKWLKTKYKPIYQLDLNNNIIKEWESTTKASLETNIKGIGNVLRNLSKTAGGFKWKYKNG